MRNFYKNLNCLNCLKNLMQIIKSVCAAVVSQKEGQQPTNLQRISNLSLTLPSLKYAFCVAMLLMVGVGNAWGATLKGKTAVGGGKGTAKVEVCYYSGAVVDDNSTTGSSLVEAKTSAVTGVSWFYCTFTATPADGYYFDAWYTNSGCSQGKQTANSYSTSRYKSTFGTREDIYYAKFLPITVSSAGTASTSFNHPETKTVTLYFPVSNNADANADFNAPTIGANTGWSISSWSLNTSTHKVEVVCSYTASSDISKGAHSATVTLTSRANKSNTGTVTANVDLTPTLTYNNGTCDISVSDADKSTLNVADLKTAYKGADDVAGDGAITYSLKTANSNVSLTSDGIFYAKATGTYTIVASAAKGRYYAKTAEFTVTVGKRTPTFSWAKTGENDHIYAGDVLTNVAQAKYGNANVSGLTYSYTSGNTGVVVVDEDKTTLRVQSTGFTTAQTVRITVNTAATDYYLAGSGYHDYYIEPKQTPEFFMNGEEIPTGGTEIHLKIGETANFSFDKIDEAHFTTPQNPQYVSYEHNSTNHTGVLTATAAGDETILFSQTGTSLINAGSRSVHVYVARHPVNLTKVLNNGTWKVDSVYTGAIYSITNGDGVHALNTVSVTSSDESVLKYVDGGWKAVGAGTARLTISHANTDYWAAETVYTYITVEKHDPVFDWSGVRDTLNFDTRYINPVTSSFTGNPVTYESNHAAVVVVHDTILQTATTAWNGVTITAKQVGNYKYNDHTETKTVKVLKMRNHVEINVTSSENYNAVYAGKSGDVAWDGNNGIRLGGSATGIASGPAWNWDDKYIDVKFEGIPDTISFTTGITKWSATVGAGDDNNGFWYMKEYSTIGAENTVWTENNSSDPGFIKYALKPNTNKVRICYTGNFAGYVKNLKITERTEITGVKTVDFGAADASSDPTEKTTVINWYNVNPLTLTIEGTNASQFAVDKSSIEAKKDSFAENVSLKLTYKHNRAAVKDTATLVITDGTKTKRIGLRGVTNKITPAITWKENLTPMQRGVGVKNPATSPVTLTYTSTDPTVVNVIGDSIVPLKKGAAQLIASFDGTNDGVYNSISDTIDVVVTDVKVQHINWTQNFKRLKWTDDEELSSKNTPDFDLVATVSYYDVDKAEEVTINRPITFTSNNTSVVQVLNGTTLHVVGVGTTTLEAHVEGITDSLYEATAVRDVIVREPSLDCESWVLEDQSGSIAVIDEVSFDLDGEADSIYFEAWREIIKIVFEFTGGDLYLAEVYEDESEKEIWHNETPLNTPESYKAPLSREAKKVRFYTTVGATGYHKFGGVYARRARYVEFEDGKATKNIAFTTEDAKPGVAKTKSFKVNYSNITDQLEFELKGGVNSKFSVVSPSAIGTECGDYGQATVTVQFLSNEVDTYKDTLLIHNLNQTLTVYLQAEVDKYHQQITWNPETTELKTTDNVTFAATTTGSAAGLGVTYHVTAGSDVATVNKTTGELTIIKDGQVTIEARAAGNESYYDATAVSKTFTISKVKSSITTAPTAETMTLPNTSLAECDLTGGSASVEGLFDWDDKTINATYNNSGYKVVFTPQNTNWYDTASCVVVVPVNKIAQVITWNFDVTEMLCNATYAFTGANAATVNNNVGTVVYETSDETIAYVDEAKNLKIVKGGNVTITARCAEADLYAEATPVAKTFEIQRMDPEIVMMPTAATMKIGRLLSDASLTGGRAELNGAPVEGAFVWVDGNTIVMNTAGTFEKQVVFAPANKNYYDSAYTTMNVTVEKYAPVLSNNTLSGTTITYGQLVSASNIEGSITATDHIKIPSVEVAGNVVWKNASSTYPAVGTPSHATAVFVPENSDWYNEVEIANVPLTVNPCASATYAATTTIIYGQRLSEAELTNTSTGVFGEPVEGNVAWADGVDLNQLLEIGSHDVAIRFTSGSESYTDGDGVCHVTVSAGVIFTGNTDSSWGDDSNWQNGNMPDADDRVTIAADVEVTEDVTIGGLTINAGYNVTVKEGVTLTIGDKDSYLRAEYGNIHVENGGKLNLTAGKLNVKNFTLDAQLGSTTNEVTSPSASGQVLGADKLDVNGDAFFQLAVDPCGHNTYGWYDFVVPFEVEVIGGISIAEAPTSPMQFNVNYAVMSYDESKRAVHGKDWNKFSGTMEPGRVYTITLDETQPWNTVVFKKKQGAALTGDRSFTTSFSGLGASVDNGWNGFGNGSLQHMELDVPEETLVQIYDHANRCYQPRLAKDHTIAVGLSFFMQVGGVETIELNAAEGNSAFLAPKRERERTDKFCLALTADDENHVSDYLWVSANEEATGEYVIGRDVLKMGTLASSKVARVWSERNGINLCSNEMPLINDEANCSIGLFAPKAGVYTLDVERAPEDAALYLTYNGDIIWDLTMSAYEFDLSKGSTEGYGLRIEAKRAPQITTGVDEVNGETKQARKELINDKIYVITPEGKMYDIVGKSVKY